jgi:hypothetical protein
MKGPLETPIRPPLTSFCLFDEALVMIETHTGELLLWDAADIRYYRDAFVELQKSALYRERAKSFLRRMKGHVNQFSKENTRV